MGPGLSAWNMVVTSSHLDMLESFLYLDFSNPPTPFVTGSFPFVICQ